MLVHRLRLTSADSLQILGRNDDRQIHFDCDVFFIDQRDSGRFVVNSPSRSDQFLHNSLALPCKTAIRGRGRSQDERTMRGFLKNEDSKFGTEIHVNIPVNGRAVSE